MSKHLWQQVKDKVDRVAEAVALMERGEFEFPDGKTFFTHVNGKAEPRVIKRMAMEYGGYAKESQSVWQNIWGEDGDWSDYYRERLAWHRQRLSGGYKAALATLTEDGNALKELSKHAYEALMYKLKDPEKAAKEFSLKDLTKLYLDSTKLEAQVKGESSSRGAPPQIHDVNVVNVISAGIPEDYAEHLRKQEVDLIEATAEEIL